MNIRLTPPSMAVFLISVILAALAVLTMAGVSIPVVSGNAMLMLVIAYGILLIGVLVKGA